MAKHHLDLDFSTQDMEEVDKEILTGHPSDETANNVDMMEDDAVITTGSPVDPSFFFLFLENNGPGLICFEHAYTLETRSLG